MRRPPRPLAKVLEANRTGDNRIAIERESLRLRRETQMDSERVQAETRILVLVMAFIFAFVIVGTRMGVISASDPLETRNGIAAALISSDRSEIVDRNGAILAMNMPTHAIYAQPQMMIDPENAARELAGIFPDLDHDRLLKDFTGARKFVWVRKKVSPEQRQAVHDIGEPGLLFGSRDMRVYPNGSLAAHVLGGASFGREGVHAAEVIGVAGVEKQFDDILRDPLRIDDPLELSIDVSVQSAMRDVLYGGMRLMNAKGAAGILMDIHTGEIMAMSSLPDFDPNDRPRRLTFGDAGDSPLFNRAVQGVYELGSTFKIFTVAQAMELGQVRPWSLVNADAPLRWGRYTIREFENKNYGPLMTVADVITKSSNVGTANMAMEIGGERQKDFLARFGVFEPSPVELIEAEGAKPLVPKKWSEIVTITASYGHGFSASPLNLAAAYASLLNGGTKIEPTILKTERIRKGERLVSEHVSREAARMLRNVVLHGTASFGDVPGYDVGGKTGTANKPRTDGRGYHDDKNINTFASVFPVHDPKYVLIVSLDEASDNSGTRPKRTAGWTAVPVAAEIIRRTAPLLGLPPEAAPLEPSETLLAMKDDER